MTDKNKAEVWLRGPLPGILPGLQPVAHALLQAREELNELMKDFPDALLWIGPAGMASVGFHAQHMAGVLDRLFTYAREEALTGEQLYSLSIEGNKEKCTVDLSTMLELFDKQVDLSLNQLSKTDVDTLPGKREIGRQKIPTTLIGLYVHAAEHTMRHIGQLLVTVKVIKSAELK